MIDGKLATFPLTETIVGIGWEEDGKIRTVLRIGAHPYRAAMMTVEYCFLVRGQQLISVTVRIPLFAIEGNFDVWEMQPEHLQGFFKELGLGHDQEVPAFCIRCKVLT